MPIVAKLDELGKPAWIALMILGFMVWWPIGLATLAFIIWSGRMSCWRSRADEPLEWRRRAPGAARARTAVPAPGGSRRGRAATAFDEYREETLRRLEEEQREFRDFLDRLRMAKDKAEFDQFMAERRSRSERPRRRRRRSKADAIAVVMRSGSSGRSLTEVAARIASAHASGSGRG